VIDGTVTKLVNFGAFVRVRDGLEGLIHISELSHQRVAHPGDVVHEGQALKLKIISLDSERHRLGLSLKPAEEAPARPTHPEPTPADAREATAEAEPGIAGVPEATTEAEVAEATAEAEPASAEAEPGIAGVHEATADAEPATTEADVPEASAQAAPTSPETEVPEATAEAESAATADDVAPPDEETVIVAEE